MDKRIKYRLVIDTETCPIDKELNEVKPSNMLTYDCGWAIVDKRGKVYRTRSFINADVFIGEKSRMTSAYYADKIPKYWEQIKSGERTLTSFNTIRRTLVEDIAEYNITEVYAHNMRFDYGTLRATTEWLNSPFKYFFPYGMEICDTLKMARDVLGAMPTYKKFCEKNGYLTARGQARYTAEIIYRFITKDTNFVESHTGLEDVLIEKEILAYCFKQHKKMRRKLWD